MERDPRRGQVTRHAKACLLAAGLVLLTTVHANPFASPEPPPPPAEELPLPPEIIEQLPPLPTPSLDAPLAPEPTSEELLAELLPDLTPPTHTINPTAPKIPLALTLPAYRPPVPAPTYLEDPTAYASATKLDPGLRLRQELERYGVQLLAIIRSGTPQAVLQIDSHPIVIPYGHTLPGGNVRVTAILDTGVILTYDGASIELPLGAQP